ncbi:unnamed protein product [Phytophthora lilii]|uniref:Unnamed protein product n=1 Tax=Phytophthora lilii TaxID=2077276 RepID=A0A9W6X3H0_9STRA|nr:unnamed protein product [Phytophthora lilii]
MRLHNTTLVYYITLVALAVLGTTSYAAPADGNLRVATAPPPPPASEANEVYLKRILAENDPDDKDVFPLEYEQHGEPATQATGINTDRLLQEFFEYRQNSTRIGNSGSSKQKHYCKKLEL